MSDIELLLTGAQIEALPKALEGLPQVERLRLGVSEIPGNFTAELRGFRDEYARRLITSDGTIFKYNGEGKPLGRTL